jgi:S-DNA-T family DNA segregation ATPase FtsK/SpoIIIE
MAQKSKLKQDKSKANTAKPKSASPKQKFWRDRRSKRITGLFLVFLCIYCLIAFTSFIFTWKADQSMLSDNWWVVLREGNYDAENWLGPLGAMISHLFIHEWFGIMSFLFLPLIFAFGYRILFGRHLFPIWRGIGVSLLAMLIFSPLLSFLFNSSSLQFLGGAFGYHLDHALVGKVGQIGTGILLIFAAAAYIILVFNPSFGWLLQAGQGAQRLGGLVGKKVANSASKMRAAGEDNAEDGDPDTAEQNFQDTIGEQDNFTTSAADLALSEFDESDEADAPWDEDEKPKTESKKVASLEIAYPKETLPEGGEDKDSEEENAQEDSFSVQMPTIEKELSEAELDKKIADFGEYDPTLDLGEFKMPKIELLNDYGGGKISVSKEELEANKDRIVTTLSHYKIGIEKIKATIGPTVTLYEIVPEPGVRISKIKNLEDDIALSLAALGIRIIAPIPGKGTIGIEVPNSNPDIVSMRSLIASERFQQSNMDLPIALGKTISNETFVTDLAKMPHLLMAGATGQGKSVGLNAILVSLLYKKHPSQIKFVLVDPKKVELTLFNKIERHYLAKLPDEEEAIITDTSKVVKTLNSLCIEMDDRYELLKDAGVRNIKEYNAKFIKRRLNPEKGHHYLPYIVLVVDEFADLIMTAGKEVETPIARLAQLARAIGIHLIIATQRPSVNIITGVIKANFPARVAFRVSSKIDSRTILDAGGADQLIGRGDMLLSTGNELIRLQCGFVDTPEVDDITDFIGSQRGYPTAHYLPEYVGEDGGDGLGDIDIADRDPMFEDAARVIVMNQQGSTSLIQRKLKLGYNRAGRIVDQLEAAGIVGPFEGSKARQVLIPDEYALEQLLRAESEKIEN